MKKLSVKMASERLGCSTTHIYTMIRNGTIPEGKWFKFGVQKGYRIDEDIIEAIKCGLLNTVDTGVLIGEKTVNPSAFLSEHPIVRLPNNN